MAEHVMVVSESCGKPGNFEMMLAVHKECKHLRRSASAIVHLATAGLFVLAIAVVVDNN